MHKSPQKVLKKKSPPKHYLPLAWWFLSVSHEHINTNKKKKKKKRKKKNHHHAVEGGGGEFFLFVLLRVHIDRRYRR